MARASQSEAPFLTLSLEESHKLRNYGKLQTLTDSLPALCSQLCSLPPASFGVYLFSGPVLQPSG